MINRRIYSSEGLGIDENLNEIDDNGNGLNTTAKFFVSFTKNIEDAYEII